MSFKSLPNAIRKVTLAFSLTILLCSSVTGIGFAENHAWEATSDLGIDGAPSNSYTYTPVLERTPELGDSSMSLIALTGLSALTLTGAVVAHKKSKSKV